MFNSKETECGVTRHPMFHCITSTWAGAGRSRVLLHGLGSCGADWRPQIDALGGSYRLIVPDLRGHGASPAPRGDWQIGDFANDLFNLMDQLDVARAHRRLFPGRHGGPGNG
jgi:pimeloyl-ACP methyl ester carboxylesterase